jgi:hypothetical protein
MIRFLADENFNNDILRGFQRRIASVDMVRVQDTQLIGAPDPLVLAWAATEQRVLLSHDLATLIGAAYERIARGEPVAGVIVVQQTLSIGKAIEELVLIAECSSSDDWNDLVVYVPLR